MTLVGWELRIGRHGRVGMVRFVSNTLGCIDVGILRLFAVWVVIGAWISEALVRLFRASVSFSALLRASQLCVCVCVCMP